MSDQKILLTNIQRFSLQDGPGIRTTVFLKGCSLKCPWCSNPENLSGQVQPYIKNRKQGTYGLYYTVDDLYVEVTRDISFYVGETKEFSIIKADDIKRLPGGVTFSGGECLLQIDELVPLCKKLNAEHIHIAAETNLYVPKKNLLTAIKHIDFFYVDVKMLDKQRCRIFLKGNLDLYLSNLEILFHSGKPVVLRIPIIGRHTDDDDNRKKVVDLISKYVYDEVANLLKVELIKEHNLGTTKWQALAACNNAYIVPEFRGVSDKLVEQYRQEICEVVDGKIPVEICKI